MIEVVSVASAVTWGDWRLQPALLGVLLLAGGAYALLVERASAPASSGAGVLPRQVLAFAGALLLTFVASASPLDAGAARLFSVHMLQHVILFAWVPPLLLLGLPAALLTRLYQRGAVRRIVTFLTQPLVGAPVFMATLWLWHLPPIYDTAMANAGLDYLMHLSFVGTGILFWWSVVKPEPALHDVSTGWRALYVLFADLPMMLLAFTLVATPSVLYDYYEAQPRLWGISAQTDQQLGGAIMGSLGEITLWIPFTRFFMRFMSDDEPMPAPALVIQPDTESED